MAMMNGGQPQAPAAEAAAPQAGGATQLVTDVHSGLMKLIDLMEQSPQVGSPEDKQKLGQVAQLFQSWVDDMGTAPGAAKPEAPMPQGNVSPEAGLKPVRRAL